MPETVAGILQDHKYCLGGKCTCNFCDTARCNPQEKTRILDAGAGDGLSGLALRGAGFDEASTYIVGADVSPKMLEIAKDRGCYNETHTVDLNKPLPYATDSFDCVACVGTLTYVDPQSGALEEFVRITRPGGLIIYTNRTDKLDDWIGIEEHLDSTGRWYAECDPIGPVPYLPKNKEYGRDVEAVIMLYRVLDPE